MLETVKFHIPFPRQTERTAAVLLRGHRFGPIKDGWILLFEDNESLPTDAVVEQFCVVRTPDGALKARIVRRGRRHGTWDLLTHTGDPELDQPLDWAEPVTMLIPYTPSPYQISALFPEPVSSPENEIGRRAPRRDPAAA